MKRKAASAPETGRDCIIGEIFQMGITVRTLMKKLATLIMQRPYRMAVNDIADMSSTLKPSGSGMSNMHVLFYLLNFDP